MSQKEKEIMQKLGDAISTMPEEKKEYLIGVADGIALMGDSQQKKGKVEKDE